MERSLASKPGKTPHEVLRGLPADLGYAMPAEWERHGATWLAWPCNSVDFPGKFEPIPWVFAEIVRVISAEEKVCLFIPRGAGRARNIHDMLERGDANLANVELIAQATDRVWARDSGPIFVRRGKGRHAQLAICDFKFNAWARYPNAMNDDCLPGVIARRLRLHAWQPMGRNDKGELQRFVLEGGSIDVNGAGCLLTTEECLLSPIQERNPGISRENIEQVLRRYLGVEKILWLEGGIIGDDTHGHVDDVARFVGPRTIVACVETNNRDVNYHALHENLLRLRRMRDAKGKLFDIVELPMPGPVVFAGQRLPASYANFYICNAGVIVPVFNDPNDLPALAILADCFRGRRIIPICCRDLVWGRGTLHCTTQQQPAL